MQVKKNETKNVTKAAVVDSDDFNDEENEDKEILKSIAYAEKKLGTKM